MLAQGQLIAEGPPAAVTNDAAVIEAYLGPGAAARLDSTAAALAGRPAKAPSKSTTCSQANPRAAKVRAWSPGRPEYTLACDMSPRRRRTTVRE